MQSADVSRARRMDNLVCGLEDVRGMESGFTSYFDGCLKTVEVSIADKAFDGVKRLTDSHWDLAVQEGIFDHAMSRGPTTNQ